MLKTISLIAHSSALFSIFKKIESAEWRFYRYADRTIRWLRPSLECGSATSQTSLEFSLTLSSFESLCDRTPSGH